jgi:hypothetical protein
MTQFEQKVFDERKQFDHKLTGYKQQDQDSIPSREGFCFCTTMFSPPTLLSSELKGSEREALNSRQSSGEVKNPWSHMSIPPYVFVVWCLIKHQDNFTFPTKCYSLSCDTALKYAINNKPPLPPYEPG